MDQDIDPRLNSADPARPTPATLDALVDDLVSQPAPRRHRWRRPAITIGSALLLIGGVAAATDLDTYLLSVPPFSTLAEDTVRLTSGLPYVSVGETDSGEQCALYLDLGGVTDEQLAAANDYWAAADPQEFADGVESRLDAIPTTDEKEWQAVQDQILDDLDDTVPGIVWGGAFPGPDDPYLGTISRVCQDDLDSLGFAE